MTEEQIAIFQDMIDWCKGFDLSIKESEEMISAAQEALDG